MPDFRTHKARTDAARPTPAVTWSRLDLAPDRFHFGPESVSSFHRNQCPVSPGIGVHFAPESAHSGEVAEYRVTFAGKPRHYVAAVHYRDGGPAFVVCECIGPVHDRGRGEPVADALEWEACRRRFAEHWQAWCESERREEAAVSYGRACIAGEAVAS